MRALLDDPITLFAIVGLALLAYVRTLHRQRLARKGIDDEDDDPDSVDVTRIRS